MVWYLFTAAVDFSAALSRESLLPQYSATFSLSACVFVMTYENGLFLQNFADSNSLLAMDSCMCSKCMSHMGGPQVILSPKRLALGPRHSRSSELGRRGETSPA